MKMPPEGWDSVYQEGTPAAWDIGRPQSAFVHLADSGLLRGRVLDAGCGSGEHALLAAARDADAMGVDISLRAIERARHKAAERGLTVRFEVADALSLGELGPTFDTVIDSGLFHVFDDADRARYVASLASVLPSGGTCYLMCFSTPPAQPARPSQVCPDELRAAFSEGWTITTIVAEAFEVNFGLGITCAQAWLATIRRT